MTDAAARTIGCLTRRCEELEAERNDMRACLRRSEAALVAMTARREVEADHQTLKAELRAAPPATAPELADERPAPACGYLRGVALEARVRELEGERDELRRQYQTQLGAGEVLAAELQLCRSVRDGHAAQLRSLRAKVAEGDVPSPTRAKLREALERLLSAVKMTPAYHAAQDGSRLAVACGEAADLLEQGAAS